MAMNKAERASLAAAQTEAALRWPTFEEPRPITREEALEMEPALVAQDSSTYRAKVVPAYFFNAYNGLIHKGWLAVSGAFSCRNDPDMTGKKSISRGWGGGYRTYQDAYRALRWATCRDVATRLHLLDTRATTETLAD